MNIQLNKTFNNKIIFQMTKTTKIIETPKTDRRVLLKIHEILKIKK